MNAFFKRIVAGAFALSACTAFALPFSNMFVFGDSLSDTGNVTAVTGGLIPGAPYFQGSASNGPLYVDVLAQGLGLGLTPSRVDSNNDGAADGNNFAYGGARTRTYPFPFDGRSLLGQLQEYQARGLAADPNALYVVFGGANNIQDALRNAGQALQAGEDPALVIAAAQAAIIQAVGDIQFILLALDQLGAENFLVPNLPNVGLIPRIRELNNPALAQLGAQLGIAFNAGVDQFLNAFGQDHDVTRLDVFALLNERVADPGAFGLTNVKERCYTGDDITFTGGGTICPNPDEYLFWDGIHPTAGIHRALGLAALAAVVPEPGTFLLLLIGIVAFWSRVQRASA